MSSWIFTTWPPYQYLKSNFHNCWFLVILEWDAAKAKWRNSGNSLPYTHTHTAHTHIVKIMMMIWHEKRGAVYCKSRYILKKMLWWWGGNNRYLDKLLLKEWNQCQDRRGRPLSTPWWCAQLKFWWISSNSTELNEQFSQHKSKQSTLKWIKWLWIRIWIHMN